MVVANATVWVAKLGIVVLLRVSCGQFGAASAVARSLTCKQQLEHNMESGTGRGTPMNRARQLENSCPTSGCPETSDRHRQFPQSQLRALQSAYDALPDFTRPGARQSGTSRKDWGGKVYCCRFQTNRWASRWLSRCG